MKKINFLAGLLVFAALLGLAPAARAADFPEALAESAVLAETGTARILYEKNKDARRGADTLVKVMTLLLAVEAVEDGAVGERETVTAADTAWFDITSKSETRGIAAGEEFQYLELLYLAFVGGADEACNIVAERVAGTCADFVARMNDRAAALGCANTNFVNTHGKQSAEQYSSAWDLWLIMREAARHPLFLEVAGAYKHRVPATNLYDARNLTNTNHILGETSRYYFRYAVGGKVSATYENGYGAVEAAEREGLSLVAVVLGARAVIAEDQSTRMENLTEARRLFEWGYETYAWRAVLSAYEQVARVPVEYGDGADYVNLRPARDVSLLLRVPVKVEGAQGEYLDEDPVTRAVALFGGEGALLTAPVRAGDELGEVALFLRGEEVARVPLVASTNVGLLRIKYLQARLSAALKGGTAKLVFASLAALIVIYGIVVLRWNAGRRRKQELIRARQREIIAGRKNDGRK